MGRDGTDEFCAGTEVYECVSPLMPNCEDRTVVCDLSLIKQKEGMILTDLTGNNTRNNGTYLAKFSYSCQEEGKAYLFYVIIRFISLKCMRRNF